MVAVKDLISEISKKSNTTEKKVKDLVEDKLIELSGMITKEAAVHLVARDMEVDLPKTDNSRLQIKNIVSGMRNVNIIGRIFKTSQIRTFQKKNGNGGKVVNIFISDGSGFIRVPLWNDQVKIIEEEIVKVGDIVHIFNGISKENIYGETEVSVPKFGGIRKVDDDSLAPKLDSVEKGLDPNSPSKANISDLVPGKFEIQGTIVQVFKNKFVFTNDAGEKGLVISCIIDDGTGDIRAVFFRRVAEEITGLKPEDFDGLEIEEKHDLVKRKVIGNELSIVGNVKNNEFFKSLEIIADSVKDLNPLEESKRLAEELEAKISG